MIIFELHVEVCNTKFIFVEIKLMWSTIILIILINKLYICYLIKI